MSARLIVIASLIALAVAAQEGEMPAPVVEVNTLEAPERPETEPPAEELEGEMPNPDALPPPVSVNVLDAPVAAPGANNAEELLEDLLEGRDKTFAGAWASWPLLGSAGIPTIVEALRDDDGRHVPLLYQLLDRIVLARAEAAGGRSAIAAQLLDLAQGLVDTVETEPPSFAPELPGLVGLLEAAARYLDTLPEPVIVDARIRALQRELIWRAGLLATPDEVSILATLLEIPELADVTLHALAGIPGDSAKAALLRGYDALEPQTQLGRLRLLSLHHSQDAEERLRSMVQASDNARLVEEALHVLASMGVPPGNAAPLGEGALLLSEETRQSAALQAAQALLARGDQVEAAALFLDHLDRYTHQYQIRAALIGLLEADSPRLQAAALAWATAQDLRSTVVDVLTRDPDPDAEAGLRSAWESGTPAMRTTLIEVFARRGIEGFDEFMAEAGATDDAELRFRAAQQEGVTLPAHELIDLARNGSPAVRSDALRAFLDLAFAEAISGNLEVAADQFRVVLDGPFPEPSQREALEGLGMTGSPPIDFERIRSFLYRPAHHDAAAAALIQLAAQNPDPELAIADIQGIIEVVDSSEVLSLAAAMLESLGGDAAPMVLEQGFIIDWQVLGPFTLSALDTHPETFSRIIRRRLTESVTLEAETFDWLSATARDVPAMVDLDTLFPDQMGDAAFASVRLPVADWTPVLLNLYHAGGVRIWLNGKPAGEASESLESPQRFELLLKPGFNRLMIQVLRGAGPWSYGVQLTDRRYQPLNLNAQELPEDAASGVGLSLDALDQTITEETP